MRIDVRMAYSLAGLCRGWRCLRTCLRLPHPRNLILQPHLHAVADQLRGVALRLGGGTIRLEREEDSEQGAAGQVKLLLQRKALEGVEDMTATVLEVLGEEDADGRQHERVSGVEGTRE
jgi:hypothetical protein